MKQYRVDISYKTILFITGFILLLWALYQIREVIVVLFVALIFMSALSPIVDYLNRYKVPKSLSIALSYLIIIAVVTTLASMVIRPLVEETTNLVTNLPRLTQQLTPQGFNIDASIIQDQLASISGNAFSFTFAVFNNFVALISVLVLTFYLLLERDKLDKLISQFFIGQEDRISHITKQIEDKLGSWLRGQIALSLIIGTLVYMVLFVLQVPYALPLAILAGFMEVVPVIGPIISSIPAILIALVVSPVLAIVVAIAYFIIQQLENHFVVPQVMKKAVGLNPLVVILAVAIGGKLLGIAGALLAVPITVVIQIITQNILREQNVLDENN